MIVDLKSAKSALYKKRWIFIDCIGVIGIAFFLFYYMTSFRFATLLSDLTRQVDFRQWYDFPSEMLQWMQYPSVYKNDWSVPFPYLPSAIAMFMPLEWMSRPTAFLLWLLLQALAVIAILFCALRMSGLWLKPGAFGLALFAVLLTDNPLNWDLRTRNTNIIYVALVMLALITPRAWLGGLLLVVSCNLKIYSGALVAALAWRKEYRLLAIMIVAGALIAVVLPTIVFGPAGFVHLLRGWLDQALFFNPPAGVPSVMPADLFRVAYASFLGVEKTARSVTIVLTLSQIVWLACVGSYFLVSARTPGDNYARLSDICVILLLPLPFSHWFQPYHAVPLLPIFVLLLAALTDPLANRRMRMASGGAILFSQIWYYAFRPFETRGAAYFGIFIAVVAALGIIRREQRTVEAPIEK